jgi:hypothetical protein
MKQSLREIISSEALTKKDKVQKMELVTQKNEDEISRGRKKNQLNYVTAC